jgi:hypothetical protein
MADKKSAQTADQSVDVGHSDAQFSTYTENTDIPETNPPAGRQVIQELGQPTESKS